MGAWGPRGVALLALAGCAGPPAAVVVPVTEPQARAVRIAPSPASPSPPPPAPCVGGAPVDDAVFARLATCAGSWERTSLTKVYGDRGALPLSAICTTLYDGDCEHYLKARVDRVLAATYADPSRQRSQIHATIAHFADPDGAAAVLDARAEGRPHEGQVVFRTGAACAQVGSFLVELVFDDAEAQTLAEIAAVAEEPLRVVLEALAVSLR